MDPSRVHQMGSLFFIKAVKVRDMLEIVGIKIASFHHFVGLDIIVKNRHLKVVSLLCKDRLCLL